MFDVGPMVMVMSSLSEAVPPTSLSVCLLVGVELEVVVEEQQLKHRT